VRLQYRGERTACIGFVKPACCVARGAVEPVRIGRLLDAMRAVGAMDFPQAREAWRRDQAEFGGTVQKPR
jgi:hypothetical protein